MSRLLTDLLVGLGSGLVGAVALTTAHEALRTNAPRGISPRMDVLGMRSLKKLGSALGLSPGRGETLRTRALGFDILANTAFYALVAKGRSPMTRGVTLGLLAGIGAVVLPPMLGLGRSPRGRTDLVKAETVGLYVLGGLAAASVAWVARQARDRGSLASARTRAAAAREPVNSRTPGMVH